MGPLTMLDETDGELAFLLSSHSKDIIGTGRSGRGQSDSVELLDALSETASLLLGNTLPVMAALSGLRSLVVTSNSEAGAFAGSFDVLAHDVSRWAEETSTLAESIARVTGQLQDLLKAG
jgi:hypothetical protein